MGTIIKNQKVKLTDLEPNLTNLKIGLGWKLQDGQNIDLDASAFMLDTGNEIRNKKDCVFYNNLQDPSGVLQHSGDNLTGGEGDCEQISVNLSKVPQEIGHITFVVTIFEGLERQQTFGKVQEAYIRVLNANSNNELVRYNLGQEFYAATSVLIADIVKINNEWYFDAVGAPFSGGLAAIANDFELNLKKG
ncbi:MAG: TerD family protein [Clostridiales bacterium]